MSAGFIALLAFATRGIGSSSSRAEPHSSDAAWSICKQFVTDRLRAPKTAEFASMSDSRVLGGGGGEYEVHSYVDAQNGFGALIRNNYGLYRAARHRRDLPAGGSKDE